MRVYALRVPPMAMRRQKATLLRGFQQGLYSMEHAVAVGCACVCVFGFLADACEQLRQNFSNIINFVSDAQRTRGCIFVLRKNINIQKWWCAVAAVAVVLARVCEFLCALALL